MDGTLTTDFTPRDYQVALYKSALENNTIIYLPTGAGKTFIAVLLIKEKASDVKKPLAEGGRRIVFLVPTVVLAQQQSAYIKRHLDLEVGLYYGSMGVDLWGKSRWQAEFEQHHVLVMTVQIFSDILDHNFFRLPQVNLLIIDECHGAVKESAMSQVLKKMDQCDKNGPCPRIVGLTAALFRKKCEPHQVNKLIEDLENKMNARVRTASNLCGVSEYSAKPKICLVECSLLHEDSKDQSAYESLVSVMSVCINDALLRAESFLANKDSKQYCDRIKRPKDVFIELKEILNIFGPWGANHGAALYLKYLESQRLQAVHPDFKLLIAHLQEMLRNLQKMYSIVTSRYSDEDKLKIFAKPILLRLLEVLRNYRLDNVPEGHSLCGLIFVQRRSSANILYHYLKAASTTYPELSFIRPLFTMGQSGNPKLPIKEHAVLEKRQKEIINDFRDGTCNLLVSTSVLEEGIDVRACNLVVRFDEVRTFCDFVQAKGRARARNASYVILFNEDNTLLMNVLTQSLRIENILTAKYEQYSDFRVEEEDEIEVPEDRFPPYMPFGFTGPRITLFSAIALINKYCSKLPSDRFSPLAPEWTINEIKLPNVEGNLQDVKTCYQCTLLLPLNSPLREEVVGEPMPTKRYAKRAVALATCIRLHELKELSDTHLLPVDKVVELLQEEDVQFEEEQTLPDEAKPGTRKRCQNYVRSIAFEFQNCVPIPGYKCYLYELEIKKAGEDVALFPSRIFGFLTTKSIPEICPFPLYNRQGKLRINVSLASANVVLSMDQFEKLAAFQRYLFENIIDIVDDDIIYDAKKAAVGLLVVPLQRKPALSLDFTIIEKVLTAAPVDLTLKSAADRRQQRFDVSLYDDTVVAAVHRQPLELYFVDEVTQLTPCSSFPHAEYKDYFYYYATLYKIMIQNLNQPLLMASRVKTNASYLIPRAQKEKDIKREIHLVPEFCSVYPLPASLWRQALLLPALIYRLNGLLLAEDLRRRLALEAKLGSVTFRQDHHVWPAVDNVHSGKQLLKRELAETSPVKGHGEITNDPGRFRTLGPPFSIKGESAEAVECASQYPEPSNLLESLQESEIGSTWMLDLHDNNDCNTTTFVDSVVEDIRFLDEDNKDFVIESIASEVEYSRLHWTSLVSEFKLEDAPQPYFKFDEQPLHSDIGPSCGQLLQALTAINSNEDINLERLEIVGDSFLKLAVSVYLYTERGHNLNEGQLTALRMSKICNKTLYYLGKKLGIPQMLRSEKFVPKTKWLPPGYRVSSEENPRLIQKNVSDKSIADSMEALIGVYLLSAGTNGALAFMEWAGLKVLPTSGNRAHANGFIRPSTSPILRQVSNTEEILDGLLADFHHFEKRINYTFKERGYLLQAFSHASYSQNRLTDCYQRLEFLGDAVLDYLVTRYIYEGPIKHSPGALTDLRSALVNNATFACLAVRNGFHCVLKHMSLTLVRAINDFISKQERNNHQVLDDYLLIERDNEGNEFAEDVEVPKALGDIFESVAGAIFLDSGMSMDAVWRVYYPMIHKEIEQFSKCVPISPVRELYELMPDLVTFHGAKVLGDGRVSVTVEIQGRESFQGVGRNSVIARCTAAKYALKLLKQRDQ